MSTQTDLYDLAALFWKRRISVLAICLTFIGAGLAYAVLAREWYRAELLMVPAEQSSTSSLTQRLGSLTSLVGLDTASAESVEPLAILRSRSFAAEFIRDRQLMPILLHEKWNASEKSWQGDESEWPDIRDAIKVFLRDVLDVREDKKSGLVSIHVTWTDPDLAAEWANDLADRLNRRTRQDALRQTEHNVRFLQGELMATNVVPLQQAISGILELEMQKLMLARGNEEYSYRVIDRAEPPKERVKPQRKLIVALSFFLGAAVAVTYVLVLHGISRRRSETHVL